MTWSAITNMMSFYTWTNRVPLLSLLVTPSDARTTLANYAIVLGFTQNVTLTGAFPSEKRSNLGVQKISNIILSSSQFTTFEIHLDTSRGITGIGGIAVANSIKTLSNLSSLIVFLHTCNINSGDKTTINSILSTVGTSRNIRL